MNIKKVVKVVYKCNIEGCENNATFDVTYKMAVPMNDIECAVHTGGAMSRKLIMGEVDEDLIDSQK